MKVKNLLAIIWILEVFAVLLAFILLPSSDYMEMSFSEKINKGYSTQILINGDSIGGIQKEGEWGDLFKEKLEENYNSRIEINNISKPGNSTFAGIVSWEMLSDTQKKFSDLIILCYGQNDSADNSFEINYEALIRNTILGNSNAEILVILESSQKGYTEKIKTIIELCKCYDIPYVDMIKEFNMSGYTYGELSDDGIHPNDLGKKIYANAVYDTVVNEFLEKQNVLDFKGERPKKRNAKNPKAKQFENCHYISANKMKIEGKTIQADIPRSAIIGLDMEYIDGDHIVKINLNREEYDVGYSWNYGFNQRHLYPVLFGKYEAGKIKISFEDVNMIDTFYGLIYFE